MHKFIQFGLPLHRHLLRGVEPAIPAGDQTQCLDPLPLVSLKLPNDQAVADLTIGMSMKGDNRANADF